MRLNYILRCNAIKNRNPLMYPLRVPCSNFKHKSTALVSKQAIRPSNLILITHVRKSTDVSSESDIRAILPDMIRVHPALRNHLLLLVLVVIPVRAFAVTFRTEVSMCSLWPCALWPVWVPPRCVETWPLKSSASSSPPAPTSGRRCGPVRQPARPRVTQRLERF